MVSKHKILYSILIVCIVSFILYNNRCALATSWWIGHDGCHCSSTIYSNDATVGENLVVGNNVTVDGNVTAQNVFLLSDGYMYSSATIAMTSAGTWYNITYPGCNCDIYNLDMESNNYTLVFKDAGRYEIHGFTSFNNSNPAVVSSNKVAMRGLLNYVEIPGSYIEKSALGGALTELTNSIQIDVQAGDKFIHQIISNTNTCKLSTAGVYTTHPVSATVAIKRIR